MALRAGIALVAVLGGLWPAGAQAHVVFGGEAAGRPFALVLADAVGAPPASEVGRLHLAARIRCPGSLPDVRYVADARIVAAGVAPAPGELTGTPPAPLGKLSVQGTLPYASGGAAATVTHTLTGRVFGPEAQGTFRLEAQVPTATGRTTCRSRRTSWRARSASGRVFAGAAASGDPVVLVLSDDRTSVQRMDAIARPACPGSSFPTSQSVWRRLPLSGGAFAGGDPYELSQGTRLVVGRDRVAGRIDGDVAAGEWGDEWTETPPDGTVVRCAIGPLAWTARTSSAEDAPPEVVGPAPRFTAPVLAPLGRWPGVMVAADLDGDGAQDIATTAAGRRVVVVRGRGDGSFRAPEAYPTVSRPRALAAADLDGDGRPELIAPGTRRRLSVLPNRGAGGFGAPVPYGIGPDPSEVAVADLDRDGRADVVVSHYGRVPLSVLPGTGAGRLGPARAFPPDAGRGSASGLAVGDLDGDGLLDVALAGGDGRVTVRPGDGAGAFGPSRRVATGLDESNDVVTADLDGDGRLDLVVTDPYGFVPLVGRADGTFSDPWYVGGSTDVGTALAADFTGDGRTDVATPADAGWALVHAGRGDGSFQDPGSLDWPIADGGAVADFNGDGRPDLAFHQLGPLPGFPRGDSSLKVFLNWTGTEEPLPCVPNDLEGLTRSKAVEELGWDACRLGEVATRPARPRDHGRVVAQRPAAGTVLPPGTSVDLWIGRRRAR